MIASLRGKITAKRPDGIVIEVNGVGYSVQVPLPLLSALPESRDDVFLHTYTHVREDALQLYGFATDDERRIFTVLIGIAGIGPKIALSVLSTIPPDTFFKAIQAEDTDVLCRVPGLGKKTAHRLILELREKLPSLKETRDRAYDDTLSALVNLGYRKAFAQEALERAYASGIRNIESLLRESLKYLTTEK
jgi:Holliday junction DNA helicase RuvA